MLLLLLAPLSVAAPPAQAPADDCALYEVIHREQLGSRNHTDHGVALRVSVGSGEPRLTCPGWKVWEAAPTEVFVFEPPAFSRQGRRASVDYTVLDYNHHQDVNRVTNSTPFRCMLERGPAGWRIKTCAETGIADH